MWRWQLLQKSDPCNYGSPSECQSMIWQMGFSHTSLEKLEPSWHFTATYSKLMSSIFVHHTTAYNGYFQENHHWNGKVVRVTVLICTGDAEAMLQCLQWIQWLLPWWPFCFCDQGHYCLKVPLTNRDLLKTIRIMAWISNYILETQWDVITHPTQHIVPPPTKLMWNIMCTNCHHKGSIWWL